MNVASLDRKSFGRIGSEGKHFLRISIATAMEDLKIAVDRIGRASRHADAFQAFIGSARKK